MTTGRMDYRFPLAELARGEKPSSAPAGPPYDHLGVYVNLALAERIEALAPALATLNDTLTKLLVKMDNLTAATRGASRP